MAVAQVSSALLEALRGLGVGGSGGGGGWWLVKLPHSSHSASEVI